MALPQSNRKIITVALLVGGFALLSVLVLVFVIMRDRHHQPPSAEPEPSATGPSSASMALVDRLVESVRDDSLVSIVQFKTDLVGTPPTPATGAYGSFDNYFGPFDLRLHFLRKLNG